MQYAWLGRDEDFWHFYSECAKEEERKWEDQQLAIYELEKEGWNITTLYYEEGPKQEFYAYGLVRLIH